MKSAWVAVKFLTIASRFGSAPGSPEQIGGSAVYFPLIGFLLGAVLVLLNRFIDPFFESEIAAAILILAMIIMTAAIHLEGVQKTFDGLFAPRHLPAETMTIYGVIAVVLVISFKIRAAEVMGETLGINLFLVPALARWALVIFLYGPASENEDTTWRITESVTVIQLVIASVGTLTATVLLTGRGGLWVALSLSLLALLFRTCCQRRFAGLSHHHMGALVEIGECLGLVLFASL